MTHVPPHKRDIGMVFQNYALFPHMTAAENIAFPLADAAGVPRPRSSAGSPRRSPWSGSSGLGDRYPRQLSGGQQQRVALARAVVFDPRLLLMDEPLGALDKKLREALQLEIMRISRQLGVTVVYVTHDQEEALVMSDRIAILNEGRIEQLGSGEDLYERPASLFVADFVGESNILRGRFERDGDGGWLTRDDSRWRVGAAATARAALDGGPPAALVVRPERLRIVGADDAGAGGDRGEHGRGVRAGCPLSRLDPQVRADPAGRAGGDGPPAGRRRRARVAAGRPRPADLGGRRRGAGVRSGRLSQRR